MMKAADYTDEWFRTGESSFRFFYLCDSGGTANQCRTLIPSGKWTRKKEDPLATGQVWYCPWCGAQYKTRFGVMIEFINRDGERLFTRASFPPKHWQDAKWMSVERGMKDKTFDTPMDLLTQLPEVAPLTGNVLNRRSDLRGAADFEMAKYCFEIRKERYSEMPLLAWDQLFHCVEASTKVAP